MKYQPIIQVINQVKTNPSQQCETQNKRLRSSLKSKLIIGVWPRRNAQNMIQHILYFQKSLQGSLNWETSHCCSQWIANPPIAQIKNYKILSCLFPTAMHRTSPKLAKCEDVCSRSQSTQNSKIMTYSQHHWKSWTAYLNIILTNISEMSLGGQFSKSTLGTSLSAEAFTPNLQHGRAKLLNH